MSQITLTHLQAIGLMEMLGESTVDYEITVTQQGDRTLVVATPEHQVEITTDGNIEEA